MDTFDICGFILKISNIRNRGRHDKDAEMSRKSASCRGYINVRSIGNAFFQMIMYIIKFGNIVNLDIYTDGFSALAFDARKDVRGKEADEDGDKRARIEADTDGDADDCRCPHYCGGGEAGYHLIGFNDYHARAEKADARNNLGGDAQRVGIITEYLHAINAEKRGHCAAETGEDMGTHTRLASVTATFKPDKSAENDGKDDTESDGEKVDFLFKSNDIVQNFSHNITSIIIITLFFIYGNKKFSAGHLFFPSAARIRSPEKAGKGKI